VGFEEGEEGMGGLLGKVVGGSVGFFFEATFDLEKQRESRFERSGRYGVSRAAYERKLSREMSRTFLRYTPASQSSTSLSPSSL
jgi:hypothetical protein